MTAPIPAAAPPDGSVQAILQTVVKPKFDAYFAFTPGGTARAIPEPNGEPWFVYPTPTMISDLVFLWSLFSDVYQVLGGPAPFADFVSADAELLSDVRAIVEGDPSVDQAGSFWHFPNGQISPDDALGPRLGDVLRTLRNGFSHSRWFYADLNAVDYWRELHWDIEGADPRFNLGSRPRKNFTMYVADADAHPWDPANFWTLKDLRILVTPSHVLRYHLHMMLNQILNRSRANVFQH
jgi:hypothetical protein